MPIVYVSDYKVGLDPLLYLTLATKFNFIINNFKPNNCYIMLIKLVITIYYTSFITKDNISSLNILKHFPCPSF